MHRVVVTSGSLPFVQEIEASGHRWKADEPRDLGGQDQGPSPHQLLLSALGACVSITLQMYAGRKGWPLESVQIELEHEKIQAADCSDCETKGGKISEIRMKLQLVGDLDQDQRGRLLEIADRCPVNRTLTGEVKVRSQVAG